MAALPKLTTLILLLLATAAVRGGVLISTDPDGSAVFQVTTFLRPSPQAAPKPSSLTNGDASSSAQPASSNPSTATSDSPATPSSSQSSSEVPLPPLPQPPPQFPPLPPPRFQAQPLPQLQQQTLPQLQQQTLPQLQQQNLPQLQQQTLPQLQQTLPQLQQQTLLQLQQQTLPRLQQQTLPQLQQQTLPQLQQQTLPQLQQQQTEVKKEPSMQPLSTSHRVKDQNVTQRFFGNNNLFRSGPSAVDKVVQNFDTLRGNQGYQGNFAPVIQGSGFQGSPRVSRLGTANGFPAGNERPNVVPLRRQEVVFQTGNSDYVTPSPRVLQMSDGLSQSGQFQKADSGQRSLGDRQSESSYLSGTISPPVLRSDANSGSFSDKTSQQSSKSHAFSFPAAGQVFQPASLPGPPSGQFPPLPAAIGGQAAPFSGPATNFGYGQPGRIQFPAASQIVQYDPASSDSAGTAVGGKGSYPGSGSSSLPVSQNRAPSSGISYLPSQGPQFQGYSFPAADQTFQPGEVGGSPGNAPQTAEENSAGENDVTKIGYSDGQGFNPVFQQPLNGPATSDFNNGQQNAPPGRKLYGLGQGAGSGGFPSSSVGGPFPTAGKPFDFSKDPLDQMNANFPSYPIFDDFFSRNDPPTPTSSEAKENANTPALQELAGPSSSAAAGGSAAQPALPFPAGNPATSGIPSDQESGTSDGNSLPGFQLRSQNPFPSNIPSFQFPKSSFLSVNKLPTYGSSEQGLFPTDQGGQPSASANDASGGEGGDIKGYDSRPYQAIGSVVQGFQDRADIALPLGFGSLPSFQAAQPALSSGGSASTDSGTYADSGPSTTGYQKPSFQPFSVDSSQVGGFQPFGFSSSQDSGGASEAPSGVPSTSGSGGQTVGFQPFQSPSSYANGFRSQPGFSSNPFSSGQETGVPAALTLGSSGPGFYGNGLVEVAPSPSQTTKQPGTQGGSQVGDPADSNQISPEQTGDLQNTKSQTNKASSFPDGGLGFQYGGQGLSPNLAASVLPPEGSFPFVLGSRQAPSGGQGFSNGLLPSNDLGGLDSGLGGKGDILSSNSMEEMGMVLPLNVIVPALLANRGRPMFPTVAFPYAVNSPADAQLGTPSVGYTQPPADVRDGTAGGGPCLSMDYDYNEGAEESNGGPWQGTVGPVAFKGGQAHLDGRGMLYVPALAFQPQGFKPGYNMRFTVFPMGDPEEQAIISNSLDPTRAGMAVSVKDNQLSLHIMPEGVGSKPMVLKQTFVGPTRVEIRHNQDGVLFQVGDRQQKNQTALPRTAGEPLYVGYGAAPSGMLEPYRGTFDSFHFDMCPQRETTKN